MIAEQLRHGDGGPLVLALYGHPDRHKAIDRIRRAFTGASITSSTGQGLRVRLRSIEGVEAGTQLHRPGAVATRASRRWLDM